jgi:hypothetical protein
MSVPASSGVAFQPKAFMLAFILRRLFQSLIVMLSVALIAFAMFRFVGDPVNQIVSLDTPAEQVRQIRRSLGLDDPFLVQFAPLHLQRGAARIRRVLSVPPAGDLAAGRARPGDAGTRLLLGAVLARRRHSHGRLHRAEARQCWPSCSRRSR